MEALLPLSLRHFKDKVSEVKKGSECGVQLSDFDAFTEGDTIESYTITQVPRTL